MYFRTSNDGELKIDNKSLSRALTKIVIPIALQSLIASSLGVVDTLMIGALGEEELTAVGLSTQLYFVQFMLLFGFISGSATFMSQYWGVKDIKNIRKVLGLDLCICTVVCAVIFFIPAMFFPEQVIGIFTDEPNVIALGKEYIRIGALTVLTTSFCQPFAAGLRVTEQTKIPLVISIIVFSTNTFLNYVLIFGKFGAPALGVKGAALATLTARLIEPLLYIFAIFIRKNLLAGKIKDFFSFNMTLFARVIHNAAPTAVNETMWALGMSMYNAAYGHMGVSEFAAVQAGNTINNLFTLALFSLGDGILILVGQQLGRGELEKAYLLAKRLLKMGVNIGIISGIFLIACSRFVSMLFAFTPSGRYYLIMILVVYGFFMPLKLSNSLHITGTLRSGGDTRFAMVMELICVWLIGVPMVFAGALWFKLPVYVVTLMAQSEEIVKGVFLNKRFLSKKWVNNVINFDSQPQEVLETT